MILKFKTAFIKEKKLTSKMLNNLQNGFLSFLSEKA